MIGARAARERLIGDGQEPGGGSAEDFVRFIRAETTKYARAVKAAGNRAE